MGRHIALALQAFIELQSFIDETSEQELNLSNAPILFHLQHDPEMLAYIQNCENDISNLNLSQVCTYQYTIISSLHHDQKRLEKVQKVSNFYVKITRFGLYLLVEH